MSSLAEIQDAVSKLPENEKKALSLWLDSQIGSDLTAAEEEAVVRSLDETMRDVDAGKGVPIEDVRKLVRSSTFCVTGMVGAARPI